MEQLHGYVGYLVDFPEVVHDHDGRVLQACAGARFTIETFVEFRLDLGPGPNGLEGDLPIQDRIAGPVNGAHRARPDFLDDFVSSQGSHNRDTAFKTISQRYRNQETGDRSQEPERSDLLLPFKQPSVLLMEISAEFVLDARGVVRERLFMLVVEEVIAMKPVDARPEAASRIQNS
jgi:hypothetical protein